MIRSLRAWVLIALTVGLVGSTACGGGGGSAAPPKADAPKTDAPSAAKSDAPAKTDAPAAKSAATAPASKVDSPPAGAKAASPVAASPVAVPKSTSWINPDLLAKAKQEGTVTFYTAAELAASEAMGKSFEAATGVKVEVVRSGGERLYSRIAQERQARQFLVDVFVTSVEAHMYEYKKDGLLQNYKIVEDAKIPAEFKDPDGAFYASFLSRSMIAYNPKIVPADQAPKSWKDLLDPKWKGKLAHSHPAYSGTTLTTMVMLSQMYGWKYYEDLAKNEPLIVQSAIEPLPLVISGERPVAALISGDAAITEKLKGNPVEVVYPEEGLSLARIPGGIFKDAPHPNAAKLFQDFMMSQDGQQIWIDQQNYTSARDDVRYPPGFKKLSEVKYMLLSPDVVEAKRDEVKDKFKDIFGA